MKYVLQIPGSLKIGGAEKVARDISLYSDSSQYRMDYIVFGDNIGEYEQEILSRGCRIFRLAKPSDNYLSFLYQLGKIMTRTKYDAVHAHTMFSIGWIMLVARWKGIPIRIAHAHSALDDGGGFVKRCYELVMRRLILKNATVLIACGERAGLRLYGEKAYRSRGKLILNGIDVRKYAFDSGNRTRIRQALGLADAFVIGHVGHLAEVKNQRFLIELMPAILQRNPKAKLLLLGDGEDRVMLETLIEKEALQDTVYMLGNVSNVHEYLSAMDVFAFPSLYEGMPLSLIEVQANGLPAVISDRVPRDVYLTELINPLSLEKKDEWIHEICNAKRGEAKEYINHIINRGLDCHMAMRKIHQLYESAT